jgi:hypothetical protein
MRIGAVKPEARSLRVSVMPSVSGSPTSRMTRSKVERSMRSRASSPVEAVSGAQPSFMERKSRTLARMSGLSSTTRMRMLMRVLLF